MTGPEPDVAISGDHVGVAPYPVRTAMERHDIDMVLSEFAPGFVMRSPVTPIPFVGSDSHTLLRAVLESYERWECVSEFGNEHEHVLITRVRIGGLDMGIVDHLRHGPDGRVVEFAAYTQPLVGAVTIARVVAPKVARRRSRARSVVTDVVLRPAPAVVGLADKLMSSMAAMHTEDE